MLGPAAVFPESRFAIPYPEIAPAIRFPAVAHIFALQRGCGRTTGGQPPRFSPLGCKRS